MISMSSLVIDAAAWGRAGAPARGSEKGIDRLYHGGPQAPAGTPPDPFPAFSGSDKTEGQLSLSESTAEPLQGEELFRRPPADTEHQ